ncbi:MAG: hypothetical protein SPL15_04825 [Lachnospiraceae bacterium]|nr:hypothetical protein [Lachnospiraceae bacterium]MDY5742302.1 hypothetical protein [Lachnospiraceae bacterium]
MDQELIKFMADHHIPYHDGLRGKERQAVINRLYALHEAAGTDEDGTDNEIGIFCREILDMLGEEYYD